MTQEQIVIQSIIVGVAAGYITPIIYWCGELSWRSYKTLSTLDFFKLAIAIAIIIGLYTYLILSAINEKGDKILSGFNHSWHHPSYIAWESAMQTQYTGL